MSKQKYPQSAGSSTTTSRPKKTGGYSNYTLNAKRNCKREEAEERQAKYQAMTVAARIKLVKSRPGENKRELARLEKLA